MQPAASAPKASAPRNIAIITDRVSGDIAKKLHQALPKGPDFLMTYVVKEEAV